MTSITNRPKRQGRRRLAMAATALAVTLVLTGCTLITTLSERGSTPQSAAPGELVDADLKPELRTYYEQKLQWAPCNGEYECATATAPMNWDDASAGDISLAVMKKPASGRKLGTLFFNPGGPGASGYDYTQYANYLFGKPLLEHFDIVGWDPRGVGSSSAVDCLDDAGMDEHLYGKPETKAAGLTDQQIIDEATRAATEFGKACLEKTGPLLEFVDTVSTVNDLDMLRAAVGDVKINYFGFSYGTDIGAQYIDRFAGRVGRVVLDGATDPTLNGFDVILAQQQGFAQATDAYLTDCFTGSSCPFTGSNAQAINDIRGMMTKADQTQPKHADGRVLTSSVIDTAINAAMYNEQSWPDLSSAFSLYTSTGDPSGFFALSDSYYGRQPGGTYKDNMFEAFFAVNCLDYPNITDKAAIIAFNEKYQQANPFAMPGPKELGDVTCQEWPFKSKVELAPVKGAGADPVLVVGNTGDPATPYAWAEAVTKQLESATLVTYEGEGHLSYGKDPCVDDAVEEYFIDGKVPAEGLRCS